MACQLDADDQLFALQLQLQEVETQPALLSGKWNENRPPDFAVALDDFEAEIQQAIARCEDAKLAQSIATAVEADAGAIEQFSAEEDRALKDREYAMSLDEEEEDGTNSQNTPLSGAGSVDWDHVQRAVGVSTWSTVSRGTIAGPSTRHATRQAADAESSPQTKIECSVCADSVYSVGALRLACGDVYCKPCLKDFFLRVAKDESLFPPTCHRHAIDISTVEADLSAEELDTYRRAELEFSSTNRIYCANTECGHFIPAAQRTPDEAACEACRATTCAHCKRLAHGGACPADEARQSLIEFATRQDWQSCYGCGEMVSRDEGCNHMTCRCRAEFCYKCGTKWKECSCGDWEIDLLHQRARQVVDREAAQPLQPWIRQGRVREVAQELERNHECDHSGKFTRIDYRRRGYVCEICGTKHWKYILSCKRCHMLACEDCRRHRI